MIATLPGSLPVFTALADLIDHAPSPGHAVAHIASTLGRHGSRELRLQDPWVLQAGSCYHVAVSARTLLVLRTPVNPARRFAVIGAHTDSPCLRLREANAQWVQDILVTGTEAYGGILRSSWFDRPLRIAGSVVFRQDGTVQSGLVEIPELNAVIPNLALHFNRDANKGVEYNPNTHMRCFVPARVPAEHRHLPWEWLAREALRADGRTVAGLEDILSLDLYLADALPAQALDPQASLVSAPRIDNLASCQAAVNALLASQASADAVQIIALFDHEEIGSRSLQGADSALLPQVMRRIWDQICPSAPPDAWHQALAASAALSVDVAHAQHPNWAELHDPAYAPKLNQGPALKLSVNHRYATQAFPAGRFLDLCHQRRIALQRYSVRADLSAGSTIGPALSAMAGIPVIDLGIPILGMHSIRETAGMLDQCAMISALTAFLEDY